MEKNTERIVGRCPVCGEGDIVRTEYGYCCDARKQGSGKKCGFIIHNRHHGIEFDDDLARKLITDGSTEEMTMWNVNGHPFQARFIIENGKVDVEIKSHYLDGRCPVCGGRIVKTGKGYSCENSIPQEPLCSFHVPGILGNRKITDSEMEDFLAGNAQVLDGFSNGDGKVFSSVLTLSEDGKVMLDSRIAVCPVCGGDILVSPSAFNCSNYSNPDIRCKFMAWRNIAGHVITKQEMQEICEEGQTRELLELYKNNGAIYYKKLGLSEDKKSIIKI